MIRECLLLWRLLYDRDAPYDLLSAFVVVLTSTETVWCLYNNISRWPSTVSWISRNPLDTEYMVHLVT